jgi:hypothetical protein
MFTMNAGKEILDFRLDAMIDSDCNGPPAGLRNHLCGFFNCFGSAIGRWISANTASGAVHQRACFTKRAGNPSARTPRCPGDHGDFVAHSTLTSSRSRLKFASSYHSPF